MSRKPSPGISRNNRISDDGLVRLEKHLSSGSRIAKPVLEQWIKRYGDAARSIINKHGYDLER